MEEYLMDPGPFKNGIELGTGNSIDINHIHVLLTGGYEHVCYEFYAILLVIILVMWILQPPCFAMWIIIIGVYLVLSLLLGMITITMFGVFFSLLYLIDRSLGVNLDHPDEHKNCKKEIEKRRKERIIRESKNYKQ